MTASATAFRRTVLAAYCFASLLCVAGLVFCLVKSPQSRSEAYMGLAVELAGEHRFETALSAAAEAVRLNPADKNAWSFFAILLQENGNHKASAQASRMAARLGGSQSQAASFHSFPAALKLSLLSDTGRETR